MNLLQLQFTNVITSSGKNVCVFLISIKHASVRVFFFLLFNTDAKKIQTVWCVPPGRVLLYMGYNMGYIGMCRSQGYGFQAVYSGIGYIN